MKYISIFFAIFILLFSVTPSALAQSQTGIPVIQGESAYLIDIQTGQELFSKNPNEILAPASTTKMMTALLAIEQGNLNDVVTASKTMLNNKLVYGTQIYLKPGEQMTLRDLLYALLLNSANDAAVDIAEYIGGNVPHFVDMMNQRASEIGATHTHFENPSGLTQEGHYTTAHDLALIAREAYKNPVFDKYISTKTHVISRSQTGVPTEMINENKLLWQDKYVNGIKTGYTAEAENVLVASATENGRTLIGVIMKSPGHEIWGDMENMLNYGFDQFDNTIYKKTGDIITSIQVNQKPVNLVLQAPIYVTEEKGKGFIVPRLNIKVSAGNLTQVRKGQQLGQVEVWNGNTLVNTIPLLADRTITPVSITENNSNKALQTTFSVACGALAGFMFYNRRRRLKRTVRRKVCDRRREPNT